LLLLLEFTEPPPPPPPGISIIESPISEELKQSRDSSTMTLVLRDG
jgi:hypothetical protein